MLRPEEVRAVAITAASIYMNQLPRWLGHRGDEALVLAKRFENYILTGETKEKEKK